MPADSSLIDFCWLLFIIILRFFFLFNFFSTFLMLRLTGNKNTQIQAKLSISCWSSIVTLRRLSISHIPHRIQIVCILRSRSVHITHNINTKRYIHIFGLKFLSGSDTLCVISHPLHILNVAIDVNGCAFGDIFNLCARIKFHTIFDNHFIQIHK